MPPVSSPPPPSSYRDYYNGADEGKVLVSIQEEQHITGLRFVVFFGAHCSNLKILYCRDIRGRGNGTAEYRDLCESLQCPLKQHAIAASWQISHSAPLFIVSFFCNTSLAAG